MPSAASLRRHFVRSFLRVVRNLTQGVFFIAPWRYNLLILFLPLLLSKTKNEMQTMRFYFGFYFYFFADSRGAGGCRI